MPEFLRGQISGDFNTACKIHDKDYEEKTIERKEADNIFYKNMKKLSRSPWQKIKAWLYFKAVRVFGGLSWKN